MKKLLFLLLGAGALLCLAGCRNAPSAAPNLAVFAPVPTENYCLLTCGKNTFRLHPDRQYALFNATPVQLPAPAAYGEEKCYRVTPGTLKNIIIPLMTGKIPARKIRRILIDPGHGGHDAGAPGKTSREKELNLLLAFELRAALDKAGFQTVMTRDRDVFLPLRDRVKLVKKYKADLFISVHHNSSKTRPDASGIECFAYRSPRPEDTMLAASVQQALVRTTGCVDRGVKFANLAVLRENPVPAILIEAGFISNQTDEKFLNDPKWRRTAARAAAEGVAEFVRRAGASPSSEGPRP
jgi:N-acetylmuramoyl-L-alanine amidase